MPQADTPNPIPPSLDIAANLAAVRARIDAAAAAAGRPGAAVQLVAISKTFGAERIRPALAAGHRRFGENRVQEAAAKWPALKAEFGDAVVHLVGHLQTNKAKEAIQLFDVIETLDRPKLAAALAKAMAETGRRPACYVQVNTGHVLPQVRVLRMRSSHETPACVLRWHRVSDRSSDRR